MKKCPICQSEEVRACKAIHIDSKSELRTKAINVGLPWAVSVTLSHSEQSKMQPPVKPELPKYHYMFTLMVTGLLVLTKQDPIVAASIIAVIAFVPTLYYEFKNHQYKKELAHWEKKWFCQRCGNYFDQEE